MRPCNRWPTRTGNSPGPFNGEIYNHVALRRELESLGHIFRTDHADSEVIVHAFEQWGIECLRRLRGMFALAIWDGHARRLWLARDRVGIKPLYWTRLDGRFLFGSEIKALLVDSGLRRRVDHESLYHYLSFLAVPAPRTLFAGVSKLPPGSWLRVDPDGEITQRVWWDPLEGDRADPRCIRSGARRAHPRRAGALGRAAEDGGRPRRRLPVGRNRLEHERGPVRAWRARGGAHLLDRVRRQLPVVSQRARLGSENGRGRRRRPSRASPRRRRPAHVPTRARPDPG